MSNREPFHCSQNICCGDVLVPRGWWLEGATYSICGSSWGMMVTRLVAGLLWALWSLLLRFLINQKIMQQSHWMKSLLLCWECLQTNPFQLKSTHATDHLLLAQLCCYWSQGIQGLVVGMRQIIKIIVTGVTSKSKDRLGLIREPKQNSMKKWS